MNIAKNLFLGAALSALAAGSAVAQETALKIGFVNLEALMVESPQGREESQRISELFAPRERDFNAKQTELKDLDDMLERDAETMGTDQLRDADRKRRELRREVQQMIEALQEDVQVERNTSNQDLLNIFLVHVRQVAEENEYDLIMTTGVVHASDAVNITPQVLGALQETYSSEQQD